MRTGPPYRAPRPTRYPPIGRGKAQFRYLAPVAMVTKGRPFIGPLQAARVPLRGSLAASGALARLRSRRSAYTVRVGGVLPCRPPPGRPRWGLPGAPGPMGLRPALGRASRAPVAGPRRASPAALCALSGSVDSPEIVNHPLTAERKRGILVVPGPLRSLGGRRKVSVDGRKRRLVLDQAALLFCPLHRARSAFFTRY